MKARDPVRGTGEAAPVDGAVLSCYSTAVAGLLDHVGLSHEAVLGGQLFLGVRAEGELLEFLHQHTPASGDGQLFELPLERHGAATAETAGEQIAAEARRYGAVIVTGATEHLPWIAAPGVAPAPHWFVLRPDGDGFTVDDRFTWIDDAGEHPPYLARVTAAEVGGLAASPAPQSPAAASRERWALGVRRIRPERWDAELPWQWLAAGPVRHAEMDSTRFMRLMLERSVDGTIVDRDTAAAGWVTGPAALRRTRDWLEASLDDPLRYEMHNDVWIAGRNRELFGRALRSAAAQGIGTGLGDLGRWVHDEVLPVWSGLVRLLRYNALRIDRGRRPKPAVLTDLERLASIEAELLRRLAAGLI